MTERSIRMPFIRSREPFVMIPGGASVPWPPEDDRFSDEAKQALVFAQDEAATLNHNHIGPVHLLVGAVRVEGGRAARSVADLGVTAAQVREALTSTMGRSEDPVDASDITLTPRAQRVMDMAIHESLRLMHGATGTGDLLLAVVREREVFSSRLLASLALDPEVLSETILAGLNVPPSYRVAENATLSQGPYDRFDDTSKRTLAFAQEEAVTLGHNWVGCEHLVLGLARSAEIAASDDATRRLFEELGLTLDLLRAEVTKNQPPGKPVAAAGDVRFTGMTKLIIELAIDEARPGETVLPQHIILAIGRAQGSIGGHVLSQLGATPERVRSVITSYRAT